MYKKPSIRELVWVGTVLPIACLIVFGGFVACATGPTLPPLPPPPGPNVNDWTAAHAPDGGAAPCMRMGVMDIVWDPRPDSSGMYHGHGRDVSGEPCDGGRP